MGNVTVRWIKEEGKAVTQLQRDALAGVGEGGEGGEGAGGGGGGGVGLGGSADAVLHEVRVAVDLRGEKQRQIARGREGTVVTEGRAGVERDGGGGGGVLVTVWIIGAKVFEAEWRRE